VVSVTRQQCDLTHPENISALLRNVGADAIVNAAAYTAVERAEEEEEIATLINATAVAALAREARRMKALLVNYSTDYVFDGKKATPYVEDDPPSPINAYGRSKLKGELAIRESGCDYLTIRTSWVYAARDVNFLRRSCDLRTSRMFYELSMISMGPPLGA